MPQRRLSPRNRLFGPAERCVETSGDVIENDFTSTPGSRVWDLSPMRLGAAKTARESAKSPDEFEAPGVEPVFLKQDQAINYAQSRASFRSGEIRILDSSGEVERTIPFTEGDRKL